MFHLALYIRLSVLGLGIVYLLFFTLVYFLKKGDAPQTRQMKPEIMFAIVVPAHNEAEHIAKTLENLKKIDYPKTFMKYTS